MLTYLSKEERLNTLSHVLGIILSVLGFGLLLWANSHKTPYATGAIVVYSISLLIQFAASAWYHATTDSHRKHQLRIWDHISIYYLIAGTYTPVCLITLLAGNGWAIFVTVWGIALVGTVLKLFYTGKYERLSLLLYLLLMGWLIVLDLQNVLAALSVTGLSLLIAGGLCYTVGVFFYAAHRIPYNHFVWHLFVLAGALCHWCFIYLDVV